MSSIAMDSNIGNDIVKCAAIHVTKRVSPSDASEGNEHLSNGDAKFAQITNIISGTRCNDDLHILPRTQGANNVYSRDESSWVNVGGHTESDMTAVQDISKGPTAKAVQPSPPPIAIVGMGMRLPGGVNNEGAFWDLLVNGKDGRCIVPKDRYNVDTFYNPNGGPGTVKTRYGYFLEHVDLQQLDASFFSMNQKEVERLDPQQRLLLEVVWECMENGGQVGWRGKKIGCYVGVFGEDWLDLAAKDTQHLGMYRITGSGDFAISNRISYEYDLKGPSMTIRTGCSSSLIGLHEACQAIYNGECNSAIIAGTNLIITPTMTIAMTEQGVLSPTGMCKTFDAKADGYARGEAINALYIKPLSDALRDGDPIRAIIRATATNCDGKTPGMACPSAESHESMMRRAYQVAGLSDLSETAFVECHGTGTVVGDPLETTAVANVFGQNGLYIGSVKPNVGHSEGASGITSLIKTTLALERRVIPPNINFSEPNPKIPFDEARLQVPLKPTPWPFGRDRASVNSFGIGGANAHVIVDSATSFGAEALDKETGFTKLDRYHLLVFSAHNSDSLRQSLANYVEFVPLYPGDPADLAHTLGARREHLLHRAFCVTDGKSTFEPSALTRSRQPPQVAFVFTGQGAQWAGMAKQLLKDFADFSRDIREMDNVLRGLPDPPSWTIEEEFLKDESTSRIDHAEFSQPLCTALQVGLVKLLRSWGISPTAVTGHSSGEIAAAFAANAISSHTAIIIAYYRGQVSTRLTRAGGMVAVGLGRDDAAPYLTKGVVLACDNSPQSVTFSGDKKQIVEVAEDIADKQPGIFVRHLKVAVAYHSHHMKDVGADYRTLLDDRMQFHAMKVPFFSSVTGEVIHDSCYLDPSYWQQNLESPVLFHSAIRSLQKSLSADSVYLEIGPHSALAGPVQQVFRALGLSRPPAYVSTLLRAKNSTASILTAVGQLHTNGVPIDFEKVTPGKVVLTNLPTFPWRHEAKYWNESRITRDWRKRPFRSHELLGSRILEGNELEPIWRNVLRVEDIPWLRDHKIAEDIVFPAAGYICMAGEAIRQLSNSHSYTLRQVLIRTALLLQESTMTEVMTSLRPIRLTDELDSDWYEFQLCSFNGTSWTKNCTGHVRAGKEQPPRAESTESLPRNVMVSPWYASMKRIGLNYGPSFRRLTNISAGPNCGTSIADLFDQFRTESALYHLHPTTIDACLQLFTVAMAEGRPRRLHKLCVPTEIEELYIHEGAPEIRVRVVASSRKDGTINGTATAMAGGEVALHLKGAKFSPLYNGQRTENADSIAGAQLVWKPAIEFLPAEQLMRPRVSFKDDIVKFERLVLLCIVETHSQVSDLEASSGHLKKYQTWLVDQVKRAANGEYDLIEEAPSLVRLGREDRLTSINVASREVATGVGAHIGQILLRILKNCKPIFAGEIQPIDILLQEDGLKILYGFYQDMWDCERFYELLGHANPTQKILEIGAGTGGMTASALKCLVMPSGVRMYSEYCYTDISAGFFVAAKERFKEYDNIQYAVLDISKDPMDQGFEVGNYDLIVVSNVLHATPSISSTLRNVRKLLAPRGRLLLQELTPTTRKFNYIMGILPGWWLGENDARSDQPYIPVERWDLELRDAGFSGTDSVVYDDEAPYQMNVNIVSRPVAPIVPRKGVTLLCESEPGLLARKAESLLLSRGYHVDVSSIDQPPRVDQDIISLLDLGEPFLYEISSKQWAAFQAYLGKLKSSGILWATHSSQLGCEDPRYSQILGAARTIRSELLIDFATIEMDVVDELALKALSDVFAKFQERAKGADIDPDWEYVFREKAIYIGRYHWLSVGDELCTVGEENLPRKLEMGAIGLWQSMRWVQETPLALESGQVEIEVRAVGLNFKDVLVCMGVVDATKNGIGLEGAGIVRAISPGSGDFRIGDRVLMFEHGCFATRVVVPAKLCAKIPDTLSFEEAATMPCVYSTVIHSVLNVGRLEKNQTILIQSACGGVGLAAIQICQMIGAEIFATVGNEEKAQYLVETFGLPRRRIFASRNVSFLADVMRETNHRGVDLVLNSLSGELLHASWNCVAEYGKMLEIGKRDFIGRGSLRMDLFEANRAFFGIDMARLGVERPESCGRILEQCIQYYSQGAIAPINPMKVFNASEIMDAFKYMQKGQHIGKIVVKMPDDPRELRIEAIKQELRFHSEASYLLVGGLGGLGRSVATWMVEHGASNLTFLSRSAGKSENDRNFVRELELQGCSVQVICGGAESPEAIRKAIKDARAPFAGIMHLSMTLKDRPFLEFTHDEWHTPMVPKLQGAWNLHNELLNYKLDFFVLFSSISGIVGQWGQGNYAAANTFLDSFVQFRHSLELSASVLDIGVMEDVGYVSQNPAVLEQFKATSAHTLSEQNLLDALHLAIINSAVRASSKDEYVNPSQLMIGLRSTKLLSDPSNRAIWKRDARMSLYRNMESSDKLSSSAENDDLRPFLAAVAQEPAILNDQSNVIFLTQKIRTCLCKFMLRSEDDVDVGQSLTTLGLDSLVAIEIRSWWRQALGLEISILEIMNTESIQRMGEAASGGLQRKYAAAPSTEEGTYLLMKAP